MELYITVQIANFLRSLLFGFIAFVVFDIFRLIRSIFKCNAIIVFIQDFLYFIMLVVSTLVFVFAINSGELQLYIFGGILLGWVAGYATYGQLTFFVMKKCRK